MSWYRSLQILKYKRLVNLIIITILLVFCLTGCSVLDFDKNKNDYITDPSHMEGLLD